MDTLTLSKKMHVTHEFTLNIATTVVGLTPSADGVCQLDSYSINLIKCMCDPDFIKRFTIEAKQSMSKSFKKESESATFDQWVVGKDLSGLSTVEIGAMANRDSYTNLKQISRLMRANGYKSKIIYLGDDKQGRRWFKIGDTTDNIKAAKALAKSNHSNEVSFF